MTAPREERLDPTAEFQSHRPALLGLAYRLLGSMWDAEDVVADAYEKWMRADHAAVRSPRAFLVTAVSRLAIDALTSARARREAYPGPWLPEPVATGELGPAETAELDDTVAYATLHLMERLSPPERAVMVLREAFAMPYDRIGEILGASAAACRQMQHRAQARLAADRGGGAPPSPAEHRRLLERFLEAARTGDLEGLTGMLSADVVAYNDGGGKVRAALRPVTGRRNVTAFLSGLVRRFPVGPTSFVPVNGRTGLEITLGADTSLVTLDARDGAITAIYTVRNPDKLAHLAGRS
ncbi:RNA polymerase sigma factor SigJ [Actinomycetospora sp. TBRC 11914]|uniref:RNA polymerase sigma factor SigJ n=1 Tax=Actinomycetospora sp. TBRC 11914 TaxID=2729387 RepID=UPI00145F8F44|nr:RNA polymerase sigma factor SigJ [Actinomycetospora sp. TBRC 11914]NMO91553.1 RNA polymerase sigma factor SigJ [Actinomycetospora sp. TBRC 11914]